MPLGWNELSDDEECSTKARSFKNVFVNGFKRTMVWLKVVKEMKREWKKEWKQEMEARKNKKKHEEKHSLLWSTEHLFANAIQHANANLLCLSHSVCRLVYVFRSVSLFYGMRKGTRVLLSFSHSHPHIHLAFTQQKMITEKMKKFDKEVYRQHQRK